MKLYFLILTLMFIKLNVYAQETFVYNKEGLNPNYIVTQVKDKSQEELFDSTVKWIKDTYSNPDEVIKASIENEMVRIEGLKSNWLCMSALGSEICSDAIYVIKIYFKDGRFKLEPISLKTVSSNGSYEINFSDGSAYYKKNNQLRKGYSETLTSIESLFNNLNNLIYKYLIDLDKNKDEW